MLGKSSYQTLTNKYAWWNQCIPYKNNEELIWTNKSPKKKHKKVLNSDFKQGETVIIFDGKNSRTKGILLKIDKTNNICYYAAEISDFWYIQSTKIEHLRKYIPGE